MRVRFLLVFTFRFYFSMPLIHLNIKNHQFFEVVAANVGAIRGDVVG